MKHALLFLLLVSSALAQGPISADRLPAAGDWQTATIRLDLNYPGANWPEINMVEDPTYTVDPTGVADSANAINNYMAMVANDYGAVLYLPPGTYKLLDQINFSQYTILRGAGPDQTFLEWDHPGSGLYLSNGGIAYEVALTADAARGDTTITLDKNAAAFGDYNLGSNAWFQIVEPTQGNISNIDDTYFYKHPDTNDVNIPTYFDYKVQWCKITAIDSVAGTFTFDRALNLPYTTARSAKIRSFIKNNRGLRNSGIEDLHIENVGSGGNHNIYMSGAEICWIDNVHSKLPNRWHARIETCYGVVVNKFRAEKAKQGGGDKAYGVGFLKGTGRSRVQNSVFINCRHSLIVEGGSSDNVFAYNYSRDPWNQNKTNTDFLMADLCAHGAGNFNLWEGNVVARLSFDNALTGNPYNVAYRNWVQRKGDPDGDGTYDEITNNLRAFEIQGGSDHCSLVANVGLEAGQTIEAYDWYEGVYSTVTRFGYPGDAGPGATDSATVAAGMDILYHGNYDFVTDTVVTVEGVSTTYPDSYYLPSKPDYFTASDPWPGIGPDVTGYTNEPPAMQRDTGNTASPVTPSNTAAPIISGTETEDEVLTTTDGTWTASPNPTYTYQWQRDTAGNGTFANITGATEPIYTLTASDVGNDVRVGVTATNTEGNATAYSAETGLIAAAQTGGGSGGGAQVTISNRLTATTVSIGTGTLTYAEQVDADGPIATWNLTGPPQGFPQNSPTAYGPAGAISALKTAGEFTLEAIGSVDSLSGEYCLTGSWEDQVSANQAMMLFFLDGKAKCTMRDESLNAYPVTSATVHAIGEEVHMAMTWDGSTLRLYVNGAEAGNTAATELHDTGADLIYGGPWANEADPRALDGSLWGVATYDTALSAARILAHYNAIE